MTDGTKSQKFQHLAGQSLRNAIRLHFDSILLYKHKSFPSSFFISVIAMEELGKAYWADHFVFYSKDVRSDDELETLFINKIHSDHRAKQLWFLRQMAKVDDRFYQFKIRFCNVDSDAHLTPFVIVGLPTKNPTFLSDCPTKKESEKFIKKQFNAKLCSTNKCNF